MINPNKLITIDDDDNRALKNCEMEKVLQTLFSLVSTNRNESKMLYRGVSYDFLSDRLSKNDENIDDKTIANRLFYFGEKAQHFRNEAINRKWLNDISDISNKTANKIFDRLSNLSKSKNSNVTSFVNSNSSFFEFFSDKANKAVFSDMINELGVVARDYYWAVLHTAGHIGTNGKSISISTSRSIRQAISFSGKRDTRRYVIFTINRTDHRTKKRLTNEISRFHVPVLPMRSSIYQAQKEETLKAGLFPHDIVGLYCVHTKQLILNPHMFSQLNEKVNIAMKPLIIDQSHFNERLHDLTNYSSWFHTFDREEYFETVA
ncbi:hypothetical protein ABIS04_17120 [Shewanella sp. H8]|uniref:hypothetical protein n=1 Tax=Shewanella sp. H8 TaxID=3342676 RepID=UPI003315264A